LEVRLGKKYRIAIANKEKKRDMVVRDVFGGVHGEVRGL